MSVVYLARQMDLPRLVAVKILLPQSPVGSPMYYEFLERFRREARLIASLEHMNIVSIYDYKEFADIAYLVIPYFPKQSLDHLLKQRVALSQQETLTYIEQAAAALDYAHARNVVHRDLKPSNFLIHSDGHLVLTDFGVAHIMRSTSTGFITNPDIVLGTPEYIAPEMIRKEPVDHHADIYELGIVLFQMLSGHVPFQGNMLMQHLHEPLPLLHRIDPSISPLVDAVIAKATAKRPEERYDLAGQLAHDLRVAIGDSAYRETMPHLAPTVPVARYDNVTPPAQPVARTEKVVAPLQVGSVPSTSMRPPHSRINLAWAPLVVMLVLLLLIGGFLLQSAVLSKGETPHTGSSKASPTSTPSPALLAQATVLRYYDDISMHNYLAAYQEQSHPAAAGYCAFVQGYQSTETAKVTFDGSPQEMDPNTYQVPMTIHATERLSTGVRESVYRGYQTVVLENGAWKIKGGNLPFVIASTPTPVTYRVNTLVDQGRAVVQAFYDEMSRQDYPAGYFLWQDAFRQRNRYCDFISRYMYKHYTVTFNDIHTLPDGTIVVDVSIDAQMVGSSTNDLEVQYDDVYTVSQEQGQWKLQSEQQPSTN